MQFRPCIDIHNGKVKQIIGSTLRDESDDTLENFVSEKDAAYYARLYREKGLKGAHVIMLNHRDSEHYEATRSQALKALEAWPSSLQAGGGIDAGNAAFFLEQGASHVIVTSYVFSGGRINYDNLDRIASAAGPDRLVLDLSAGRRDGRYYVVTDRWQRFTDEELTADLLERLEDHCAEFLIHGIDVEGKNGGMDTSLVELLASYTGKPVTYAGGISSLEQLSILKEKGRDRINVTVGSALDIFGGSLALDDVIRVCGA